MKQLPLVSVVIPTYNRSWCIKRAIKSVLNQTYKNWELIIIDDGSVDNTKEVIIDFLKDSRISYYYKSNSGVSSARNQGMKIARGDFLVRLDSDDQLTSKVIEEGVNFFKMYKNRNISTIIFGTIHSKTKMNLSKLPFKEGIVDLSNYLKNHDFYDFEACSFEDLKLVKKENAFFDEDIIRESVRHMRLRKKYNFLYVNYPGRIWNVEGEDRILYDSSKNKFFKQYIGIKRYLKENQELFISYNKKLLDKQINKLLLYAVFSRIHFSEYLNELKIKKNYFIKVYYILIYFSLNSITIPLFLKLYKLFSKKT